VHESVVLTDSVDTIDWHDLASLFERAPLDVRSPALLRDQFVSSQVRCFAHRGPTLVGAGRALTDRISWTLILDVVVAPDLQRRGIGREVVGFLAQRAGARNVMLHAAPGVEDFYCRQGFHRMRTAFARFADIPRAVSRGYIEGENDGLIASRGGVWLSV
jgi:aralkylamine N-acetyltransferase